MLALANSIETRLLPGVKHPLGARVHEERPAAGDLGYCVRRLTARVA